MIAGHLFIINQGKWFIPSHEKYNIHTRWVSDFAAVYPEGWFIKGSIILFCIALSIFKWAKLNPCKDGLLEHTRYFWTALLTIGLIAGLLLVVFFDVSPPKFTHNKPSWWEQLLGDDTKVEQVPLSKNERIKQGHHKIGFQMFIFSYAAMLLTAILEKLRRKDIFGMRRDILISLISLLFMAWLFAYHNSLAGIPQRALLIIIFWWVWREGACMARNFELGIGARTGALPNV